MGASFRNTDEIVELAGCDRLTIAPALLEELDSATEDIKQKLSVESATENDIEKIDMSEGTFRWMLNEDAMATVRTSGKNYKMIFANEFYIYRKSLLKESVTLQRILRSSRLL